jgi:S-methylmethionine-dependent homocysteine/selenocysteine methylase
MTLPSRAAPLQAASQARRAARPPLLLLDGGTGRELARIGAPFRQPEWSALSLLEGPEFVSRVHAAYVAAGADIITTNSYAVVPFHLGAARFAEQGSALAALAGRLAREVADAHPGVRVAGSLPPPCGSYRADLFDHATARPILDTLIAALRPFVDHWQAETLSAIEEAELVRECLGSDARPLWLSFTLQDEDAVPGQPKLRSGQRLVDAAAKAIELGAAAVLLNCSQPEVMGDAVDTLRTLQQARGTHLPIGVYANAFPPQPKEAKANDGLDDIRSDLNPKGYLAWAQDWHQRGADIIGGCCGIGPEHIAALRQAFPRGAALA